MSLFQNILLPLDITDPDNAAQAIDQARLIAAASGGRVHLLYVRLFLPRTYAEFLPEGFEAEEARDCEVHLTKWADRLGLPAERVTKNLRRGSVPAEVQAEAEARQADLIIIGSHMPSFTSKMLGSNASSIVRDAKVSVLVVRGSAAAA